jgi:hypothetical protein
MKKCPNCETYAKNSETKSDIIGDLWSVLDQTLYELPVGYIPAHTYESIPERVEELVKENANMNNDWDKAMDTIEECMPQFFADAIDGSITEAVTILIKMLNNATLGEWSCLEELEALQGEIEMTYKYYTGFGAKKDLTTTQMLNHILKNVPNYKPIEEEGHDLEDMKRNCDHYIEALEEITKKNRKAETCRMIALKALGELDYNNYLPAEFLVEENLKLRMELEDVQSKLADAVLDKISVMKPKPTRGNIKPHGGETYCSHCARIHWIGDICKANPNYKP